MTGRVAGKTAIVTGAASAAGIGFATARALAREGANVVLTDLHAEALSDRAQELRDQGARVLGLRHDVTSETDWRRVLDEVEATFGAGDVLVNNAGIAVLSPLEALSAADWQRQLDVSLTSVYLGCQAFVERLRRTQRAGSIVNVSSIAALVGMRRCSAYAAAKGGVRLFSKSLALETAAEGIRVNSVHPGVISTDMQRGARSDNVQGSERIYATIPMQRMGRAAEVAAMILFLAAEESSYITGAEFAVDGGFTAQ